MDTAELRPQDDAARRPRADGGPAGLPAPRGQAGRAMPPLVRPGGRTGGFRVSERFLQALLPMAALSLDGTALAVNDALCRLLGMPRGHLETRWVDRVVAAAAHDLLRGSVRGSVRGPGRGSGSEPAVEGGQIGQRLAAHDGRLVPVEATWTLMRDADQRPWYLTAVYVDQTERVRAEQTLAASEARWRALLAHAADVSWTADADGTITWVTPTLARLGWADEDVVGRSVLDLVHPGDSGAFGEAWRRITDGRSTQERLDVRIAAGDGAWVWVRETLTDLRADPQVGAVVVNTVDITESRHEQAARERQEQRFRDRFRNSRIPQGACDRSGRLSDVNPALCALLGLPEEQLLGRPVPSLSHPDDPGLADPVFRAVLAGRQESGQAERVLAGAGGEPIPVQVDLSLLRDEDGEPEGAAAILHDLRALRDTERRRAEQELLFAALTARATDLAIVTTEDGTLVYASPAVRNVLGYEPCDVLGRNGWDCVHRDDVAAARTAFDAVVAHGGTTTFTVRVRSADGTWRWMEETATNVLTTALGGVVCNLRDVTDRVEAERALRRSEARYRAIVETAEEGILAVTPEGRTVYANAKMAALLGVSLPELYGSGAEGLLARTDAAADIRRRLRTRATSGAERYEVTYQHPDGSERRFWVSASPLPGVDGGIEGSLAMVSDVTEARRVERAMRHAAQHDPLTGLPNRVLIGERLGDALTHGSGPTAVLFIDLDDFKYVNDSRGHEVGDELLLAVSARVRQAARAGDTVGRFGGDEFVVVLPGADEDEACRVARRLLDAVGRPVEVDGLSLEVAASVGVAVASAATAGELLRWADLAMYAAKSSGRRVEVFRPALAQELESRVALAADLRLALANDDLTVAYQPILDLASRRVVGIEALARWSHPEHGEVAPDRFVPLAESSGLAPQLDRWVLDRALRDAAALRVCGHDLHVAVNLSARTLSEPALDAIVTDAARRAGVPPTRIVLEVTESALMDDPAAAIASLRALRDRGFQVAVDDFGTGYSSLAYLRDLPITSLKIDRSFVADLATGPHAVSIVRAVVDLAAAVDATVVAEGVETGDQADVLRGLGCRSAQGWLWSRAVPLDQLTRTLADPEAFAR